VNAAFLAGGLVLLLRRRINWRIPGALLAALTLTAAGAHAVDADRYGGVLLHLFSGATMLGAFFIATDPVTSPATPRGQLVFGAGAGVLTYVVRAWGAYPDGIAIAVLCMNTLTPLIDRFSQPRLLGAGRPTAGAGYEREPEP
jgi:electron transport complex protein RnfD